MKALLALILAFLAGCAGYDGRTLLPHRSTADEVERVMGQPTEKRAAPNGETVFWYPRLPSGRVSYAARIGADGKLIAIEQRLTRENFEQLKRGESRADDVRDLLGPPWRVDRYPRREREAWTYQAQGITPQIIVAYFSRDGVLREKEMFDDPEQAAKDGPM
jgi:hypothetical protein